MLPASDSTAQPSRGCLKLRLVHWLTAMDAKTDAASDAPTM